MRQKEEAVGPVACVQYDFVASDADELAVKKGKTYSGRVCTFLHLFYIK